MTHDPLGLDGDTLHEECGVFGILGHPEAATLTALGLHALQHRGQEAAGIVTYDSGHFIAERHPGLVGDAFGRPPGFGAARCLLPLVTAGGRELVEAVRELREVGRHEAGECSRRRPCGESCAARNCVT